MLKTVFLSLFVLISPMVWSGVTITGTRIIFPSNQNSVSVQLNNPLNEPALVQSWIDVGNPDEIPSAEQVPFFLTPPLAQIHGKKGQLIRILKKNTNHLAGDRESIFWFNVLDIPPMNEMEKDQNKINISIRSRLKLFYRPSNLKISPERAYQQLKYKHLSTDSLIEIENPTPYFINYQDIVFSADNKEYTYSENLMLEPFSKKRISPKIQFTPKIAQAKIINDFGAIHSIDYIVDN